MSLRTKHAVARRRPVGQVLADWPIWMHRVGLGRLLGRGYAVVCTTGRRTGERRRASVVVMRADRQSGTLVVLAGGQHTHWLLNLMAGSTCEIWAAGERFSADHRLLPTTETVSVLAWYRQHRRFQARLQAFFFGWRWTVDPTEIAEFAKTVVGVVFQPKGRSGVRRRNSRPA